MKEKIILVDLHDQMIGTMDKMAVHRKGALHRAFSVFLFNSQGQLLLQQRASEKYHSGGLWTNTCCGHPRPGEQTLGAAGRRLREELGLTCELEELFHFVYRHEFDNGLTEHEYDHVVIGFSDELPDPDPAEVADFSYLQPDELTADLRLRPEKYTAWLNICFNQVLSTYKQNYQQ